MEYQAKRVVRETGQVSHIALHEIQSQAVPLGHQSVLLKLSRRVVQDNDSSACSGQKRSLLASGGGEAQRRHFGKLRKPLPGNGPRRRQHHVKGAAAGGVHGFGTYWLRPAIALVDASVPGVAIVSTNIQIENSAC